MIKMYFADSNEIIEKMRNEGKHACDVLGEKHGCVNGCKAGDTGCQCTEDGEGGAHEGQEGILVISRSGMASIGDEEFKIYPGVTIIVPAGVRHVFKRDDSCEEIKLFWFHAGV